MKNKIIIFTFLLSAGLLSACSGDHASTQGGDSVSAIRPTNPYRDTFATTNSTGEATTLDNSGSGGTKIVKPHPEQVNAIDTTKK